MTASLVFPSPGVLCHSLHFTPKPADNCNYCKHSKGKLPVRFLRVPHDGYSLPPHMWCSRVPPRSFIASLLSRNCSATVASRTGDTSKHVEEHNSCEFSFVPIFVFTNTALFEQESNYYCHAVSLREGKRCLHDSRIIPKRTASPLWRCLSQLSLLCGPQRQV